MMQCVLTIFLWLVAAAFIISDFLCVLALFHHRRDREFVIVIGIVMMIFAMIAAAAVYMALAAGRCL